MIPFQLILLDCRMPVMDGFEVAECIAKDNDTSGPSIMMLTSDCRRGDIKRIKDLNLSGYVIKPLKRAELKEAVNKALGGFMGAKEKPADLGAIPANGMDFPFRILLVEDNEDNRMLIQAYLKKLPYKIDTAENGEIAVEKFTSGKYDIVLMDVEMPVMDGYTATMKIREWENEQGVEATPIVALTAHALKEHEQRSCEVGCNGHVTKPVKKVTLVNTIRKYAKGERIDDDGQ
ncbi:Signal transduction response regulator, receiver region domain protein [Candidatus Magnetobacterium bavaricum]|uniref:Signal transduction response regulator, receiver region domain protein n=1 Tax=Candidatus Magnetobacterium bavaricum TaxID=29290 RepID=A0A0F3GQN6_9BACT|nr:Signal transduction response regulator, receiver region domain protein [Candidatus Magnetobacterium bavaricum]